MDIAQIIAFMYPDAIPMVDYQIGDDGSGPRIVSWTYAKAPQPDAATLAANAQAAAGAAAWSAYQAQAKRALQESDITVLRCYENGVFVPAAWTTYRKALRTICGASGGDPTQPLPVKPAYPAGT